MMSLNWSDVGSIATAVAVFVAAWQVRRGATQVRTEFEDDLSREYRELSRGLPVKAVLGDRLEPDEMELAFPRLIQYIDLCNEQVFLRVQGRVSKATWLQWRDGIRANLARPGFAEAWRRVKAHPASNFQELRRLESEDFQTDPQSWRPPWRRLGRWLWA